MKERLKELRTALKLTQFELADKANIGRSTYAMFETGDRVPKDIHISAICSVTGISEEWLRTGTGEMFKPSDEAEIAQLVERYHLRPLEKSALEAFVNLPEAYRDGVMAYIKALVASAVEDDDGEYQAIMDRKAERETQRLRENPAFNAPEDNDGEEKAHA